MMDKISINKHIVADPHICHGKPTFKKTRIMVWQILDMLEGGLSQKEILDAFPSLTRKHVKSALSYATDLVKGENYVLLKV